MTWRNHMTAEEAKHWDDMFTRREFLQGEAKGLSDRMKGLRDRCILRQRRAAAKGNG